MWTLALLLPALAVAGSNLVVDVTPQGFLKAPPPPPLLPFNYSNTLSSHACLQRAPQAATVFGYGPVFATFTVTLLTGNSTSNTTIASVLGLVASDGSWRIQLPPQDAGGPYLLHGVTQIGYWENMTESWTLTDIMFCDVIVCGGQVRGPTNIHLTLYAGKDIVTTFFFPPSLLYHSLLSTQTP